MHRPNLRSPPAAVAAALALTAVGGCKADDERAPRAITIVASDYRFTPAQLVAGPDEALEVTLDNHGSVAHTITFELPAGDASLGRDVRPEQRASMMLTAPEEPGDYAFYCPIDNHRALGMVGTLSVLTPIAVGLAPLASGLTAPIAVAFPGEAAERWFIADQIGVVRTVRADGVKAAPFLDLRDRMVELRPDDDERGLLGLALHPEYPQNGRFYVHYSAPLRPEAPPGFDHTGVVAEYRVDPNDPDRADPTSARTILAVDQPQPNHNGGALAFGPDGYLYIALGDGGGAGDVGPGHVAGGNAQAIDSLLGSVLRLDVDGGDPYAIPADNPFVGRPGADEIFAYGLRDPSRFSFDGSRLYAGDVGEALWEEIDILYNGGNYGWNLREGTHCFDPERPRDPPATCASYGPRGEPLIAPVIEFRSARAGGLGDAVIGGHVYRGELLPELAGRYVFGARAAEEGRPSGALFYAVLAKGGGPWPMQRLSVDGSEDGGLGRYLLAFGEDPSGELYVLTSDHPGPSGETGQVFKLVRGAP